tara:strand:- start:3540 stop:4955 length:1416 start_codon:yes stop_codon:yes gene_type:complete
MTSAARTPLHSAKSVILASLKQVLATPSLVANKQFFTHSIELDTLDVVSLMPFINLSQKVLFCDREGDRQYLGLKFIKSFSDTFAIEHANELINDNPELIIFGGQRFHPNQKASYEWQNLGTHFYVLPQFIFTKRTDNSKLLINIPSEVFTSPSKAAKLLMELEGILTFKGHAQKKFDFIPHLTQPSFDQWQNQVAKAHESFKRGELEKVVLSRKEVLSSQNIIRPDQIFEHLNLKAGEHFIFHIQWRHDQSFTTMTPERLFKLDNTELFSDAIAGTRSRGENSEQDHELENELKNSDKELSEHRFVSSSIRSTMHKLGCEEIEASETESILKLTHVQHLYTKLSAKLYKQPKIRELINAFHPTPAVGGTPKEEAVDWLLENESYDRGFFAAPVGVLDAKGAEFCVAIRSALVFGKELHVYAGAGIVAKSTAQDEWSETANKMKNFMSKFTQTKIDIPSRTENNHEQHPTH